MLGLEVYDQLYINAHALSSLQPLTHAYNNNIMTLLLGDDEW